MEHDQQLVALAAEVEGLLPAVRAIARTLADGGAARCHRDSARRTLYFMERLAKGLLAQGSVR